MGQALKVRCGSHEEFAAPEMAIRAISRAVPGYANRRPFAAMLRQTTGDVRMMMLHRNVGQSLESKGVLAREIPGMQVVCHRLRDNVKKLFEVRDALNEGAIGLVVFQVADVVAQEGILPPGQTEGVLQMAATGEDGHDTRRGKADVERRIATCTA